MFQVSRKKYLAESIWEPRSGGTVDYVEAWQIASVETCTAENYRNGVLRDCDIEDWLGQTGIYAAPSFSRDAVVEGGLRLLFCERTSYLPPGFSISRESFVAIEKSFRLPAATLESIYHFQGVFSDHAISINKEGNEEQLGILIKVPHKIQVGTYVLSLSHDYSTGWTLAFIHGDGVTSQSPAGHKHKVFSISDELHALIMSTPTHWAHPLLLPTILLKNYMNRADVLAWALDDQVVRLESSIGVTFAGRLRSTPQTSKTPSRSDMRKLTLATHTALTEVIFFSRVIAFTNDCATYLLKIHQRILSHSQKKTTPNPHALFSTTSSHELYSTLQYIASSSTSMHSYVTILKDRIQSQIQVLFSISAQTDNRLSARIAVSSGRDSTAMKTLAFITALFLPGTYVATLFSMSMFDWHTGGAAPGGADATSSSSSSASVAENFWIYWVTTVPLTVAVIICWRLWWVREAKGYSAQLAEEMDGMAGEDGGEGENEVEKHPLSGMFVSRKGNEG